MKISIILPAYNAQDTIIEAIDSVLAQTYSNFELLVCLDACTDNTESIVRSFNDRRIRILVNDFNLGAGKSRDKAIAQADGEWFTFLDADDTWELTRLEKILDAVKSNPRFIAFDNINFQHKIGNKFTTFKKLRGDSVFNLKSEDGLISVKSFLDSPTTLMQPFFSKNLLDDTNARHSNHVYGEDSYFLLNLMSKCEGLVYLSEALYNYRISNNSASSNLQKYDYLIDAVSSCIPLFSTQPDIKRALIDKIKRQKKDKKRFEFSQLIKNKQLLTATLYFIKYPLVLCYLIEHNVKKLLNR